MMDTADQLLERVASGITRETGQVASKKGHLAGGQESECRLAPGAGGIFPTYRRSWAGGSLITPKT